MSTEAKERYRELSPFFKSLTTALKILILLIAGIYALEVHLMVAFPFPASSFSFDAWSRSYHCLHRCPSTKTAAILSSVVYVVLAGLA